MPREPFPAPSGIFRYPAFRLGRGGLSGGRGMRLDTSRAVDAGLTPSTAGVRGGRRAVDHHRSPGQRATVSGLPPTTRWSWGPGCGKHWSSWWLSGRFSSAERSSASTVASTVNMRWARCSCWAGWRAAGTGHPAQPARFAHLGRDLRLCGRNGAVDVRHVREVQRPPALRQPVLRSRNPRWVPEPPRRARPFFVGRG